MSFYGFMKDQKFQDLQSSSASSGFAIVAVIVAMTVAITLFTTIASIIDFQNKRTRVLSLKLDSLEVENFIVTVLSSRQNCQCQFGNRFVNLGVPPVDLTLTEIRSGCDLNPGTTDNIIVKVGDPVKDIPGAEVDSIALRNISMDPDNNRLYHAHLTVQYEGISGNDQTIRPSILDFRFFIDPLDAGFPTNTQIQTCFTPVLGSHECRRGVNESDTLAGCEGTVDVTGGVTSFGYKSGHSETESLPPSSGPGNTFVGEKAGKSNTTGAKNTFIGARAGEGRQTGSSNVLIGVDTGACSGGVLARNTMMGNKIFKVCSGSFSRSDNVILGDVAWGRSLGWDDILEVNKNVFVGAEAGSYLRTGEKNVFIGGSQVMHLMLLMGI